MLEKVQKKLVLGYSGEKQKYNFQELDKKNLIRFWIQRIEELTGFKSSLRKPVKLKLSLPFWF